MQRKTIFAAAATAFLFASVTAHARDGENRGWPRHIRHASAGHGHKLHADPRIVALVSTHARAAGVPQSIAHALIRYESGYKPHITGRAHEIGLGQIKCGTARLIGFKDQCRRLYDASTNLTWSMRYLRLAINKGGATCAGLSLYNRGIWAKRLRCTGYGRIVMANARRGP